MKKEAETGADAKAERLVAGFVAPLGKHRHPEFPAGVAPR